ECRGPASGIHEGHAPPPLAAEIRHDTVFSRYEDEAESYPLATHWQTQGIPGEICSGPGSPLPLDLARTCLRRAGPPAARAAPWTRALRDAGRRPRASRRTPE